MSIHQRKLLKCLILYSRLFLLSEKEALEYIKEKLGRSISRRTYFYYKNFLNLKSLDNYTIFLYLHEYLKDERMNKNSYIYYPNSDCIKKYYNKISKIAKRSISDFILVFNNFKLDIENSEKNFNSIPSSSVTIREEYIKCSRLCNHMHGPYYYAYFRDKNKDRKKLIKRYLGKINPKENNKEFKELINEILNIEKKC